MRSKQFNFALGYKLVEERPEDALKQACDYIEEGINRELREGYRFEEVDIHSEFMPVARAHIVRVILWREGI